MTIPFDTTKPNMARMYDYWLGRCFLYTQANRGASADRARGPEHPVRHIHGQVLVRRVLGSALGSDDAGVAGSPVPSSTTPGCS